MTAVDDVRRFITLVRDYDEANYGPPPDPALIQEAERRLGVRFPPSFRIFLTELGSCDVAGQEFYGVWVNEATPDVLRGAVEETLDARRETGLPEPYVVFYADGMGGHFVLDTSKAGPDGEAPVFVWVGGLSQAGDELEFISGNFGSCALTLATNAL